jgi:hypothetical protein
MPQMNSDLNQPALLPIHLYKIGDTMSIGFFVLTYRKNPTNTNQRNSSVIKSQAGAGMFSPSRINSPGQYSNARGNRTTGNLFDDLQRKGSPQPGTPPSREFVRRTPGSSGGYQSSSPNSSTSPSLMQERRLASARSLHGAFESSFRSTNTPYHRAQPSPPTPINVPIYPRRFGRTIRRM